MRLDDRTFNRLKIARLLRSTGAISRVELAQRTGLNKATITAQTDDLIHKGLLVEDEPSQSQRGRPRTNLRIRKDAAYALGFVPLMNGTASIDLVDLQGDRVYHEIGPFGRLGSIDDLASAIVESIEICLDSAPMPRSAIAAAGIVIPGQGDCQRGVVHWMPQFGRHAPVPLKALLEEQLALPVVIDNRATVLARAQHWFSDTREADDFSLFALMELGMSGAVYRDAILQSGVHGMNAEMSHIKVAFEGGRPCFCGGTGCLGSYVTTIGIAFMLAERRGQDLPEIAAVGQAFAQAVADARAGNGDALAVFDVAGQALGTALASHANEHDPGRLIVTGTNGALLDMVQPAFHRAFDKQLLPSLRDCTVVEIRPLQPGMLWQGAAALAIEAVFLAR